MPLIGRHRRTGRRHGGGARRVAGAVVVCLIATTAALTPARGSASASSAGAWRSAAPPIVPRSGDHTTTLLRDGRVLLIGGATCGSRCAGNDAPFSSTELYDPATDRWSTTDPTTVPRESHTATLLQDGRVLVAGGYLAGGSGTFTAAAETYSPDSGHWKVVGPMHTGRIGHTATLLPDGRVLVAGGITRTLTPDGHPLFFSWSASTEIFDPATGLWRDGPPLSFARSDHTATLLRDGTVLVTGGRDAFGGRKPPADTPALKTAELYDPAINTWTSVPHFLHSPRVNHTATPLPDGSVLLVGGAVRYYHGGTSDPTASAEIYHPATRTLTDAPPIPQPRLAHSAVPLADGRVLITGGLREGDNVRQGLEHHTPAAPELYDPSSQGWSPAAAMIADPSTHGQRSLIELALAGRHTTTLLPGGRVLVVGGDDGPRSAQLFDPAGSGSRPAASTPSPSPVVWAIVAVVAMALVAAGAWWLRRRRLAARP